MTPNHQAKLLVTYELISSVCCDHITHKDTPQELEAFIQLKCLRDDLAKIVFTFHNPKEAKQNNTMGLDHNLPAQ